VKYRVFILSNKNRICKINRVGREQIM